MISKIDYNEFMNAYSGSAVGVDIDDRSIEFVWIRGHKQKAEIVSLGRVELAAGVVDRGRIVNSAVLAGAIKQGMATAMPKPIEGDKIVCGLPDRLVFTHAFEVDHSLYPDVDKMIKQEGKAAFPIAEDDLVLATAVVGEFGNRREMLMWAMSRLALQEWQTFWEQLGVDDVEYEVHSVALVRGLFERPVHAAVAVVDIGSLESTLVMHTAKGIRNVYTADVGGELLTETLSKQLQVSRTEAENMKIAQGLSDAGGQVSQILVGCLQPLVDTLQASLDFFYDQESVRIQNLILAGGTGKLKGLGEYLHQRLGVSVHVGEAYLLPTTQRLEFVGALGMAMRGVGVTGHTGMPVFVDQPHSKNVMMEDVSDIAPLRPRRSGFLRALLILGLVLAFLGVGIGAWYQRDWLKQKVEMVLSRETVESSEVSQTVLEKNLTATESTSSDMASPTPEPKVTKATIADNELGFLNVRAEPSTQAVLIRRVTPGESYEVLEVTEEWVRIILEEGVEGWVSLEYVSLDEE